MTSKLSLSKKELKRLRKLAIQKLIPTKRESNRPATPKDQPTPRFSENASLISYNEKDLKKSEPKHPSEITLNQSDYTTWLNLYGLNHPDEFNEIVKENGLDSFLINMINDQSHRTKVVSLKECFFFSAKSIHYSDEHSLSLEQMMFVVSPNFIWSIQEKVGDNFDNLRERIEHDAGKVRKRGADYLLFLILESIVDDYYDTYEGLTEANEFYELNWDDADPDILEKIEIRKSHLFRIKKSIINLREAIVQIHNLDDEIIRPQSKKYFIEMKEQASYLLDQIENDMSRLESATNLFFSLQSHRLNEVMKTLTILSVIFIPLTFIVGIYGMNFEYMPELGWKYGYFIILGFMAIIGVGSVIYFKRKKWF